VHRHGPHAVARQSFDEPVGAALGAHEHERSSALWLAQLGYQARDLALVSNRDEAVLDVSLALLGVRVLVPARVGGVGLGDAPDLTLKRGGEQQRLALTRAQLDDPVDDRAKAHVEHPVGLGEHEQLDAVKRYVAPVDQIE